MSQTEFFTQCDYGEYRTIYMKHSLTEIVIENADPMIPLGQRTTNRSSVAGILEPIGGSWDSMGVAVKFEENFAYYRYIVWFSSMKAVM